MKRLFFPLLLALLAVPTATAQPAPSLRALALEAGRLTARPLGDAAEGSPSVRPDVILHQVYDGSVWVLASQRLFVYEDLFRSEEWSYVRDGQALYNDTRTTYQANPAAPVAELAETWDRSRTAFVPARRHLNLRDGYGLRTGLQVEVWDGAGWVAQERTRYTFLPGQNGSPRVNGGTTEVWDGAAWTPVERYELVQTEFELVETRQSWDGAAWVDAERIRYPGLTFSALDRLRTLLGTDLADFGDLALSLRYVPRQIRQTWDGAAWIDAERLVWEGSPSPGAQHVVLAHEIRRGDAWVPETRLELFSEPHGTGTRVSAANLHVYGSEGATVLAETYRYDHAGNLAKAEQQLDTGTGLRDYAWYNFSWKYLSTAIEGEESPAAYALEPAYPNPFNPQTTLTYRMAVAGPVSVRVYDALGRRVATLFDGVQAAGAHEVTFRADNLPSGLYLVRLEAPGVRQTRSVTLAK